MCIPGEGAEQSRRRRGAGRRVGRRLSCSSGELPRPAAIECRILFVLTRPQPFNTQCGVVARQRVEETAGAGLKVSTLSSDDYS